MLQKDTKKSSTIYHKQFGRAEFVGWYDHEAKEYAIIRILGMNSRITLPRKELSDTPQKIKDIKPGWYSTGMEDRVHFYVADGFNGSYRSACGKAKAAGGEMMPELDEFGNQGSDPEKRCRRCEVSARGSIKTTLFDFRVG